MKSIIFIALSFSLLILLLVGVSASLAITQWTIANPSCVRSNEDRVYDLRRLAGAPTWWENENWPKK